MIAVVHTTVWDGILERTLDALRADGYRLRPPAEHQDPWDAGRVVLNPVARTPEGAENALASINLYDHEADAMQAIAHAIECLVCERRNLRTHSRIEDALETIVHSSIAGVPDRSASAIEVRTATPWHPFSIEWWLHADGPRDGRTVMEAGVDVDELLPACVLIDQWHDADGIPHIGMCSIKRTIPGDAATPDPVETLRILRDLVDRPIDDGIAA